MPKLLLAKKLSELGPGRGLRARRAEVTIDEKGNVQCMRLHLK